eukprot:127397-Rhodomonas_salina.1
MPGTDTVLVPDELSEMHMYVGVLRRQVNLAAIIRRAPPCTPKSNTRNYIFSTLCTRNAVSCISFRGAAHRVPHRANCLPTAGYA